MATTIIIKNSSIAGKVPDAGVLQAAELAINLSDQKLYSKDTNGNVFELSGGGAQVPGGPTPPNSGNEIGDLFFDTDLGVLLYWNGTDWVPVAGQDQWVVEGGVITPDEQDTTIGCGGSSRTDPDASLAPSGQVYLRRVDGTDDPKIVMATDNNRTGLIEFTSDGPDAQRISQWEFKDDSSNPGGDDGGVVIKGHGGVDLSITGADDSCLNVDQHVSRNWALSDSDAIRVRNYDENVFTAGDLGAVSARKSFTVGDVGTSGANIPGLFKGVGNDQLNGDATDTAFELEFNGSQVFAIDYQGKATGASTEDSDPDNTLVTKDYLDALGGEVPSGGTDDRPTTPGVGDLYWDTDLEILLIWNGTDWVPVGGGDAVWTQDSGKLYPTTLSNNVQVGGTASTPNISLNADGSATFKGAIDAGAPDLDSYGLFVQNDRTDRSVIISKNNASGNVFEGRDGTNAGTSFIKNDGSATFAGDVQVGNDPTSSATANGLMFRSGGGVIARRATGTDNVFAGFVSGSASETSIITADGSATFAGPVSVGEIDTGTQGVKLHNGYVQASNAQANYNVFRGELNKVETSSIKADGSASFTGNLFVSDNIEVTRTDGAYACYVGKLNNDLTSTINADGSASFASYDLERLDPLPA